MRNWIAISIAMFAFGLGCVASQTVIPPARAQATSLLWEHLCEVDMELHDINAFAKRAGEESWEMAGAGHGPAGFFVCFKRPK